MLLRQDSGGSAWEICSVCKPIHFPAQASTPHTEWEDPGLWESILLPTSGPLLLSPHPVPKVNTRSDDPGNKLPTIFTAPEPLGHSTISTLQRQNVMERKGTNPKSSNQGYDKGHGERGLWQKECPLWRGAISLETQYLRKHIIWFSWIWNMFMGTKNQASMQLQRQQNYWQNRSF